MSSTIKTHFQDNFDAFNRNSKIPQYELVIYYARMRHLVLDAVLPLLAESPYFANEVLALVARFVTDMNYHRKIVKRSVLVDAKQTDAAIRAALLSDSMDLLAASAQGRPVEQFTTLHRLALSRSEYQTILRNLAPTIRSYNALHAQLASARRHGNKPIEEITARMRELLKPFGIRMEAAYGLFRHVERRMRAVQAVTHHIFGCYARILAGSAKKVTPRPEALMDTLQDGAPGLLHAIRTYDHVSRKSFSTHASIWVRQRQYLRMKRSLNTVRPSLSVWQSKITDDKQRVAHEYKYGPLSHGTTPFHSTLSPVQMVQVNQHRAMLQTISLDAPLQDDDRLNKPSTKQSLLGTDEDEIRHQGTAEDRQTLAHGVLSSCEPSARRLLSLRYGVEDLLPDHPVPAALALRERVRQIAARAHREAAAMPDSVKG